MNAMEDADRDAERADETDDSRETEPAAETVAAITADTERRVQSHVRDAGGFGGWRVW